MAPLYPHPVLYIYLFYVTCILWTYIADFGRREGDQRAGIEATNLLNWYILYSILSTRVAGFIIQRW